MESLSETNWDVVVSGTGLQQSLLALALSRSDKNILHVDPNEYYGETEAALTLQEVEEWVEQHKSIDGDSVFSGADVTKHNGSEAAALSRTYSLALAPQLIHTRSELLSQLVSSKAFRQLEFQAVGSFYIYQPASEDSPAGNLARIPSTREDVFANKTIPARSKRGLMKFLLFVLDYNSESQTEIWKPHAGDSLANFLAEHFKLDAELQAYIVSLTLSLDGEISVEAGLSAIHRHLSSMGVFGPGFAAVYPKWGGLSEVAQVGCRAGAVGGAVYMLGVGIKEVRELSSPEEPEAKLEVALSNGISVKTKALAKGPGKATGDTRRLSRLTAVINTSLSHLFMPTVEGAPTPSVSVVAFPAGTHLNTDAAKAKYPIYAMLHSSDTGECPAGQCIIYLSTISSPESRSHLEYALSSLIAATPSDGSNPTTTVLYQLYYEQVGVVTPSVSVDGITATFSSSPLDLAFNDAVLKPVQEAWNAVTAGLSEHEKSLYLKFEDREGADAEDEFDT